jgi:hypothetical protein
MKMTWQRILCRQPFWGYAFRFYLVSAWALSSLVPQGLYDCRGAARSGGRRRGYLPGDTFLFPTAGGRFVFSVGLCGGNRK